MARDKCRKVAGGITSGGVVICGIIWCAVYRLLKDNRYGFPVLLTGISFITVGAVGILAAFCGKPALYIVHITLGIVALVGTGVVAVLFFLIYLYFIVSGFAIVFVFAWILTLTSTILYCSLLSPSQEADAPPHHQIATTSCADNVVRLPADSGDHHMQHSAPYVIKYSV